MTYLRLVYLKEVGLWQTEKIFLTCEQRVKKTLIIDKVHSNGYSKYFTLTCQERKLGVRHYLLLHGPVEEENL